MRRLGLLVCFAALAAAALIPASAGARRTAADRKLDQALHRLVRRDGGPPGAIAIVQRGKRRVVHRAGVANLKTGRRPRGSDHMRIASVAKAYSGAVALSLVDAGKLSLDDTIGSRLPSLPSAWYAVTLRELLQHTSGLPSYTTNKEFLAQLSSNPRMHFDHSKLLDYVRSEPLEFAPGTKYEYSNSDNIAVGMMVEAVTGESYESQLASFVYDPLDLAQTSLPSGFAIPRPFIHGYDVSERKPQDLSTVLSASGVWASGGIIATPFDLNSFIRGYVGRRLFGRTVQDQQFAFVPGESEPRGPGVNAAGAGIFRYKTACGTVFGHTGNFPGYTQFAAAARNGKRSVTVSVNTQLANAAPGAPAAGDPKAFAALRKTDEAAVCAALGAG